MYKDKSESFKLFMLKVTYSLWFSHVFSYETFENDTWHQKNPDWTVCQQQTGEYFYNLKRSTTFDKETLVNNQSDHKKIYLFKIYLEKFFNTISTKYLALVNKFLLCSTFIQNEIETENTVTTQKHAPCKTYIQSSYSEDNNNKNCNSKMAMNVMRDRIKNDRITKKKRHDVERKWNDVFHEDIEKQKKVSKN